MPLATELGARIALYVFPNLAAFDLKQQAAHELAYFPPGNWRPCGLRLGLLRLDADTDGLFLPSSRSVMKKLGATFLLLVLLAAAPLCVTFLYNLHGERGSETLSYLANLPAPLARAMTLEYSGVASDHLMLKALTYMGQKIISNASTTKEEWQAIYRVLQQCINLDPRFLDPYVLAQMTLPGDAGMVVETNALLEKAAQLLVNDYRPHFFLWV